MTTRSHHRSTESNRDTFERILDVLKERGPMTIKARTPPAPAPGQGCRRTQGEYKNSISKNGDGVLSVHPGLARVA